MECLVTKLKAVVNDDSLDVLGELVLNTLEVPSAVVSSTQTYRNCVLRSSKQQVVTFTGNSGYATTSSSSDWLQTLTLQAGVDTTIWLKNGTGEIHFADKYSLTKLSMNQVAGTFSGVYTVYTIIQVGDVAKLRYCPFTALQLRGKGAYGDIHYIIGADTLDVTYTLVGGDITGVEKYIPVSYNKVYGDLTESLRLAETSTFNMSTWIGDDVERTADVSAAPAAVTHIAKSNGAQASMTWKGVRPSTSPVLSMEGLLNFGTYLDTMLINQAECVFDTSRTGPYARIVAYGTRTSSSDSAVATLKQKGLTVIINGTTL